MIKNYKLEDKIRLDNFRKEYQEAIAKLNYLTNVGKKLNNPNTSQNTNWKIINKVTNKCKAPKIRPLLVERLICSLSSFQSNVNLLLTTVFYPT